MRLWLSWHPGMFGRDDRHFTGVTVTNGAGSARDGIYARYTDEDMQKVRRVEQKKAAVVGDSAAHVFWTTRAEKLKTPRTCRWLRTSRRFWTRRAPR